MTTVVNATIMTDLKVFSENELFYSQWSQSVFNNESLTLSGVPPLKSFRDLYADKVFAFPEFDYYFREIMGFTEEEGLTINQNTLWAFDSKSYETFLNP